ncbi:MAG: carbohydrate kinase [Clostridia bacterium]|nr:carbohydrate kinase [Clostridia bacterium]
MPTLCADIFDGTGEILPGGEALNLGCIACRYPHMDVALLGAIGADEPGAAIHAAIDARPIDRTHVHVIEDGATATHRIYHTPEGDRYFKPDSWQGGVFATYRLTEADSDAMNAADVVFCTWYSPNFREVLACRREGSFRLAVDFDIERDLAKMEAALPFVDFFFISGDDAFLPTAKAWSERFDAIFNVTLAERGSVTYVGGREYRVSAVPVSEVIDTTGCGDSYHGAFLSRYLLDGDVTAAMHEGSRVASQTLSHMGGF